MNKILAQWIGETREDKIGLTLGYLGIIFLSLMMCINFSSAFSGAGAGTPSSPYQITNWTTLSEMRNNLTASYILMNNLSSSTIDYVGIGDNWLPVGTGNDAGQRFKGELLGNYFTISDLKIINPASLRAGLFGTLQIPCNISNLGILNVNITTALSGVGGLAGSTLTGNINITNVYTSGNINNNGDYTGGLLGNSQGGIYNRTYSSVNVIGTGNYVGGLLGGRVSGTTIVHNSYATGSVNGSGQYTGGLAGTMSGEMDYCYSTGLVKGVLNVGGLIGASPSLISNNSYWDNQTSNQTTSANGTAKTTAQMKTASTFLGWNTLFWKIGDGYYPLLYTDLTKPTITLSYPTSLINYGAVNGTLQLNLTATDSNLASVWYNYNGTNVSIAGAVSGVANLSNITLSSKKNVTIYANDTAGNLNTTTFTWDYKVFENSQNYTTPVYETQLVSFTINLTYDNTASLTATFNYDGTNYTSINSGSGNNALFSTPSFNIPLINSTVNKTFFWILNYNNSITITPSQIQTVNPLIVSQCNGTYTIKALNFTFFEEQNQTNLNATANPTTFLFNIKYWIGDGAIQKNYSYQNLSSSLNNFQFCLNENLSYQSDVDVQYFANNYAERTFYMRNNTISNITQNITLYNLLSVEATKFTINLRQSTEVFANALVEIKKYYTGLNAYKLIMIGLTDAKGKFTANIDLDQTYNFSVIKDGINYGNFEKEAICQVTPCEIDLNADLITLNPNDVFYDYFAQNVDYNLTQNDTEQMVYLSFKDNLGTAHYWRLLVTATNLNNNTIITICDETAYSPTGSLSCNYTGYDGELSAKVFISRSPEKLVDFINWVNSLDYKTFGESAVLASVIIVLIIFFAGVRNPVTALVLIPFALVVLKLIQLMPLTWGWILGILIVDFWLIRRLNT